MWRLPYVLLLSSGSGILRNNPRQRGDLQWQRGSLPRSQKSFRINKPRVSSGKACGWTLSGVLLSLPAIFLVSLHEPSCSPVHGSIWLVGTIAIFFKWGLQAHFVKSSANAIGPEELFVYMTTTGYGRPLHGL